MAAAYAELLSPEPFNATTFPNDGAYDELVVVRDIPFHSLRCAARANPARAPSPRRSTASSAMIRGPARSSSPSQEGPPMPDTRSHVIVGAGLAGAKAAEALREEGFDGPIVLVGTEPERPYERPPLSKDYLRGESEREKAYVHPAGFYEEHGIELRTGTTVERIDTGERAVELEDGERLAYDRLLLATGAEPRHGRAGCRPRRRPLPARLRRRRRARGAPRCPAGGRGGRRRLDRLRGRRLRAPEGPRWRSSRWPRCRSSACSGARWARSTRTSTATTASSCTPARGSRRSRATAGSSACGSPAAARSTATSWWWASA